MLINIHDDDDAEIYAFPFCTPQSNCQDSGHDHCRRRFGYRALYCIVCGPVIYFH